MSVEDNSQAKRERRERMLAYVVGVPLIAFFLTYEVFGWLPPIPRYVAKGLGLAFQTGFALFVSAIMAAWCYLFLLWLRRKWLRLLIAAIAGLWVGFGATFNPGASIDLLDNNCRPAGPGIYNDC